MVPKPLPSIRALVLISTWALTTCSCISWADTQATPRETTVNKHSASTLKVMNLNIAHGRKDSLNQLLVTEEQTRSNLKDVAKVLDKFAVDVLALQEADAPSFWSGGFNHVTQLSTLSSYPESLHSLHATNWIYSFGTALISKVEFIENIQHTFTPSPPTTNKGFTLGQIAWQYDSLSDEVLAVDVVSIHLDFSRKTVREQQVSELISVLEQRDHPLIIMGDFNSDWQADELVVRELADRLSLHTHLPESRFLGTYPPSGRRLDWILASRELEFVTYENLPDTLSDHLAIVATLRVKS